MANVVRDDAKARLCCDGKALGLVEQSRLPGTIVRLPGMVAARPSGLGPFHQLVVRRELVERADRLAFRHERGQPLCDEARSDRRLRRGHHDRSADCETNGG